LPMKVRVRISEISNGPKGAVGVVMFYRPIEVQARFGVSIETVRKWRREGLMQGHAVGRGYIYDAVQLDEAEAALRKREIDLKNQEVVYRG
jgi:predicted nucleotidyltransferase